jgi:hypothetical protein
MEKITIKVPEGKTAVQSEEDGTITIQFKNKPKDWTEMETFEEFYEAADDEARREYDGDHCTSKDGIAYNKLRLITRVTNTDRVTGKRWVPDWNDKTQKKWGNYLVLSSGSGVSVSTSDYHFALTYTTVGSRLCFERQDQADGIRKKFYPVYVDYLTIKN